MNKTVYIHIGTPKTGTTSIQKFFCVNNQKLFDEFGVFYPIGGRLTTPDLAYMNGNFLLHNNFLKGDNFFQDIIKKFENSKCDAMVLSEEQIFLYGIDFKKLDAIIKKGFSVKVIVYFRNSMEYLCGIWQEYLKDLGTEMFVHYVQSIMSSYKKNLQDFYKISDAVGKENIIARVFEKDKLKSGDVVDDFFEIIGINNFDSLNRVKVENEGFSRERLDKYLFINRTLSPNMSALFKDMNPLNNIFDNNSTRVVESFSDQMIREVCDYIYPIECEIARDFLGREELFTNKYPAIYGKKRSYKGISSDSAPELNLAVSLQQLEVQNKIYAELQNITKTIQDLSSNNGKIRKINISKIFDNLKKVWANLLCLFIFKKEGRKKIRKKIKKKIES